MSNKKLSGQKLDQSSITLAEVRKWWAEDAQSDRQNEGDAYRLLIPSILEEPTVNHIDLAQLLNSQAERFARDLQQRGQYEKCVVGSPSFTVIPSYVARFVQGFIEQGSVPRIDQDEHIKRNHTEDLNAFFRFAVSRPGIQEIPPGNHLSASRWPWAMRTVAQWMIANQQQARALSAGANPADANAEAVNMLRLGVPSGKQPAITITTELSPPLPESPDGCLIYRFSFAPAMTSTDRRSTIFTLLWRTYLLLRAWGLPCSQRDFPKDLIDLCKSIIDDGPGAMGSFVYSLQREVLRVLPEQIKDDWLNVIAAGFDPVHGMPQSAREKIGRILDDMMPRLMRLAAAEPPEPQAVTSTGPANPALPTAPAAVADAPPDDSPRITNAIVATVLGRDRGTVSRDRALKRADGSLDTAKVVFRVYEQKTKYEAKKHQDTHAHSELAQPVTEIWKCKQCDWRGDYQTDDKCPDCTREIEIVPPQRRKLQK